MSYDVTKIPRPLPRLEDIYNASEIVDTDALIFDGKVYEAKHHTGCGGCIFNDAHYSRYCNSIRCGTTARDDGRSVIFIQYIQEEDNDRE